MSQEWDSAGQISTIFLEEAREAGVGYLDDVADQSEGRGGGGGSSFRRGGLSAGHFGGLCVCVCVCVFYNQDALNISSNGDNQMWAYELSACTVGNCF